MGKFMECFKLSKGDESLYQLKHKAAVDARRMLIVSTACMGTSKVV